MKTISLLLLFSFIANGLAQEPDDHLLLHYAFNGNTNDSGINGFDATNYGATLAADRFGNPDSAYYFDGIDDYINFPNVAVLKPEIPVSFAFWVKYESTDFNEQVIFNTSFEENHATSVVFNAQSETGRYAINWADGSYTYGADTRRSYVSNSFIETAQWHSIVITVSNALNMKIYVDCVEAGGEYSGNGGALQYSLYPGCIGRHDRSLSLPPGYFKGYIDDFRYYDTALSLEQIETLCAEGLGVADVANEHSVLVYPNPADDKVFIADPENLAESVTVYNLLGQVIFKAPYQNTIDITGFPQGTYLFKITGRDSSTVRKVIVR